MKRYFMLAGSQWYPESWNDFICSADNLDELVNMIESELYNPDDYIASIRKLNHKRQSLIDEDNARIAKVEARRGEKTNFSVLKDGDRRQVDWIQIIDWETEKICWTN